MQNLTTGKTPQFSSELAKMFNTSSVPVIVVDQKCKIIYFNESSKDICQCTNDTVFLTLLTENSSKRLSSIISDYLSNKNSLKKFEARLNNDLVVMICPATIELDKKEFFSLNIFDISEYKLNDNKALHTQKISILGQLSASVVHDFNNILSVIIARCDVLLMDSKLNAAFSNELLQIQENAYRAAKLINEILLFASDKENPRDIVNISLLIENLLPLIIHSIGRGITFSTDCKLALFGEIDRGKLEQVIMNLVINARDAVRGNGAIKIHTYKVNVDKAYLDQIENTKIINVTSLGLGEYIVIKVTDTGDGIKREILPSIFEPYVSTKKEAGSIGIGLSNVLKIVKQFDGHIEIQTEENSGSSFYIYIKAIDDIKLAEANFAAIDESKLSINHKKNHHTKKILLVDDEKSLLLCSKNILAQHGYNVLIAESSKEAFEIIRNEKENIFLVITDVIMPDVGGIELFQQTRESFSNVQFLFTSGYIADKSLGDDLRNCKFLNKPYSSQQLIQTVQEIENKLI